MGNQHQLDHSLPRPNQRFGRWKVVEILDKRSGGHRLASVRCDCGAVKEVSVHSLRRGLSRSCGCLHSDSTIARNKARAGVPRLPIGWTPNTHELAWAAGLIDGEGCTTGQYNRRGDKMRISFAMSQSGDDADILYRFRRGVGGLGTIRGPYFGRTGQTKPIYRYTVWGHEKVQQLIAMVWPWLSEVKRAQAARRLREARERRSA